jgi:hypothetical protein
MIKKTIFFNFCILTAEMLSRMIDAMNIRILPFIMSSLSLVIFITEAYGRPSTETRESDSFFRTLPKTFKCKPSLFPDIKSSISKKRGKFHTAHPIANSPWEKRDVSPKSNDNDNIDKEVVSNALSKTDPWFSASISDLRTEMARPVKRSVKRDSGSTLPKSLFPYLTLIHENKHKHVFSYLALEEEFQRKVAENHDLLNEFQEDFRIKVALDMFACITNPKSRQLDRSFYARKFSDEKSILANQSDPIFGRANFDDILFDALTDYFAHSHEKSKRRSKKEGSKTATPPLPPEEFVEAPLQDQTLRASSQSLSLLQREGEAQELNDDASIYTQGQLIYTSLADSEKIPLLEEDQDENQFYNSEQNRNTQTQDFLYQEEKASKTRGLIAKGKGLFKTALSTLFDVVSYSIRGMCDSFGNTAYFWWGF